MDRHVIAVCVVSLLLSASACSPASEQAPAPEPERVAVEPENGGPNTLTAAEAADGWTLLFDGSTMDGWRGLGREEIPAESWIVEDGTIRKVSSGEVPTAADGQPLAGGDIMTVDVYADFELALEWKVAPGANSGIKYNVSEELSVSEPPRYAALGFEYQILDDDLHPDAENGPNRMAGALYDLLGPSAEVVRPVGAFNTARIVFHGSHGEHWLNGAKVVEFDLDSPEFAEVYAKSKYDAVPGFADRRTGHIVLQDHGNDVWFRNIKIRELTK